MIDPCAVADPWRVKAGYWIERLSFDEYVRNRPPEQVAVDRMNAVLTVADVDEGEQSVSDVVFLALCIARSPPPFTYVVQFRADLKASDLWVDAPRYLSPGHLREKDALDVARRIATLARRDVRAVKRWHDGREDLAARLARKPSE